MNLLPALIHLKVSKKSTQNEICKTGRTHLMDAIYPFKPASQIKFAIFLSNSFNSAFTSSSVHFNYS